jgi:hypothetical protein
MLGIQHYEICHVEMNQGQLKGQKWIQNSRTDEIQLNLAPYKECWKLLTENTFSKKVKQINTQED